MDATNRRKKTAAAAQTSLLPSHEPRLVRSRSGAPTAMAAADAVLESRLIISTTKQQQVGSSSSQRYSLRSKSTTKSRPSSVSSVNSSLELEKETSTRGRHSSSRRVRTAPPSPSAWSRSPGRGPLFHTVIPRKNDPMTNSTMRSSKNAAAVVPVHSKSELGDDSSSRSRGSSISKVLKYFRSQKKVPPSQAEELHSLRILHNRLLQWRFANARAEAAMAVVQHVAQERFVRAWIRNWELRESVVEKQIELQQVVAWIKLYEILMPQIDLLQEWPALETKYRVGLSRLIRKLSAFSCLVPVLEDGAQVDDVYAVKEAMAQALQVMDSLTVNATLIQLVEKRAEKMQHLLTETLQTLKQEWECLQVVETVLPDILSLVQSEECLRAMVIELTEDIHRGAH